MQADALDQAASAVPQTTSRGAGSPTFKRKLAALKDILNELRDLSRTIEKQRQEAGRTVRLDGHAGGEAWVKVLDEVSNRFRGVVTDLQNQGDAGKAMLGAMTRVGRSLVQANVGLELRDGGPLIRPSADHQIFNDLAREAQTVRHRPQKPSSGPPEGSPPHFDRYG